jgi:hypothetical protein
MALCQIAIFIDRTTINFASPQVLVTYFETSFGHPDRAGTGMRELHQLQPSKDFSAYLPEFRRIMGKLMYHDAVQMDTLENGLSNKLKDALVFTIKPNTMAKYEGQLFASDNRMKARDDEKKGSSNTIGQYITHSTTSSFAPTGLSSLDLSATHWQNTRSLA